MADVPPQSSQESHYEKYKIIPGSENAASSPIRHRSSQKLKKPPTVTPKRFNKFFTPRSTQSILAGQQSKAGRQLRDITKNGINRRRIGLVASDDLLDKHADDLVFSKPAKRRKISEEIASSPPQSSPLKHVQTSDHFAVFEDNILSPTATELESLPDLLEDLKPFPKPIRRLRVPGTSRRILERSFGGYDALSRGRRGTYHTADVRAATANFFSTPKDIHPFRGTALPFCTTSCNTNSLIAVGDEEGSVRLVDSSGLSNFTKAHVKFRVHHNAIMDLAFNSDDYILATASGDQSGRVVDMHTQQTRCILSGHTSSVKRIQFQPNTDNIITTSSRDGSVMLWDLRVGGKTAVQSLRTASGSRMDGDGNMDPETRYTNSRLNVGYGHRSSSRPYGVDSELSITSFQHMPHGREHLILTASEVDASVKLWDLRNSSRRSDPVPLSSSPLPESHQRTRNYGINAIVLSGDGARLYTVCRDSTVYVYSTNHLALGHLPEMSSPSRRRFVKEVKTGLAPLYGFKHPSLRVGTFYIKAALRPSRGDRPELLAIGSTDKCPIVFPTDESQLPGRWSRPSDEDGDEEDDGTELPSLPPPSSQKSASSVTNPRNPCVFEHGTALVRGHNKEVTSLAWSHDGDLISVSDDFTTRCWREDATKARELRSCGEVGGGRWRAGWAEVDAAWDEVD